jgi:glycosyltransferase involved in cell wall biosynthesis
MSGKIKICFILSHFVQGGAERQTLNLIRGLDKRVYDITLLIYGAIDIFYFEIYDIPIVHIVRKSHFRNKIIKHVHNAYFLRKFLKKRDFDILHTLLFHNGFWVRLLAPRKYNQRIIFSIRNDLKSCPKYMLLFEKLFIKKSYVVSNNYRSKLQYQHLV